MGGTYVHIPFCKTHCTYCAFYSELLRSSQGSDAFVRALCDEIASEDLSAVSDTLYIGGGTPSVLDLKQFAAVREALGRHDYAEFTVEVNPDDIVKNGIEYVSGLVELGVNRISMGVQSFDDSVLHKMGRRHNASQAIQAYSILRQAGVKNVSIDLIFGFSEDLDTEQIRRNLLEMGLPQHISCYQLGIEERSGLEKMAAKGLYVMPADEQCEAQYYKLCSLLAALGYEHYEISNWALPGFESRHNSSYWSHKPYIGFGPGAHSLLIGEDGTHVRRWNNEDLSAYIKAAASADWQDVRGGETLDAEQLREEDIFLGLRTSKGVPASLLHSGAASLVPAEAEGFLRIPENKWFVSDSIILELL